MGDVFIEFLLSSKKEKEVNKGHKSIYSLWQIASTERYTRCSTLASGSSHNLTADKRVTNLTLPEGINQFDVILTDAINYYTLWWTIWRSSHHIIRAASRRTSNSPAGAEVQLSAATAKEVMRSSEGGTIVVSWIICTNNIKEGKKGHKIIFVDLVVLPKNFTRSDMIV